MIQLISELAVALAAGVIANAPPPRAVPTAATVVPAAATAPAEKPPLDRSGGKQKGKQAGSHLLGYRLLLRI